ncbi:MAG: type restriction protein res subunit [Myxococcaceae bacterium]|nr:type restriction protein res subunit [Myxococcaceae bacterium]
MILRPVQLRAVDQLRDAFGRVRRVLLVAPTGFGKTACAAELMLRAYQRGRRVLFLVHRREIVKDTARRMRAGGVPCGVAMVGEPRTDDRVQVASIQTITARELVFALGRGDLVVFDEAHHCDADTYRAIAAVYPEPFILGLTATPERSDRRGLRDAFDEIVIGATVAELVRLELLAPIDVVGPAKRQSALSATPLEAYQRHALGRPTVAFVESVGASRAFAAALGEQGIAAAHLDGNTPARRREAILEDFDAGRLDVLSNVFVLTEGWDSHRAEVCLLARGCDAPGPFLQMIGRVRRFGDHLTKRALLIDLCGAVWQHRMPDAHREWTLDGLAKRAANDDGDAIRQCPECGAVYVAADYPGACPNGHERPAPPPREVKPAPLVRITSVVERAEMQREFDRLSQLARERRWKPKAVGALFKQRFGFWPAGFRETRRVA